MVAARSELCGPAARTAALSDNTGRECDGIRAWNHASGDSNVVAGAGREHGNRKEDGKIKLLWTHEGDEAVLSEAAGRCHTELADAFHRK